MLTKESLATIFCSLALSGCANLTPQPASLSAENLKSINSADQLAMRAEVEAITAPLTLEDALARALKYNLDRRAKMMEEALALNQLDVTKYDLLPKLLAQAGYSTRNNDKISQSRNTDNGELSQSHFISQDKTHETVELGLTWSMLDLGLGYFGARQQADRVLIAAEKRRKAMHVLMQDVRTAYWRAASAQQLRKNVTQTIVMAEEALVDARKAENERLRNPLDTLRYQRQLLENLRLLEAIDQELSSAEIELASLINAPLGQPIPIAVQDFGNQAAIALQVPLHRLEEEALEQNADLREQHYNSRIAREETHKTLLRLFPYISFSYGIKYDSDSYLVHHNWNEAGLQITYNLFNLLTASPQIKLADAGVMLADQRRMATQLAVLTQVNLARLQLLNARKQFERAEAIYAADRKIAEHVRNREVAQAQSKLDQVSNETAAILSLLRRYQALSQVQIAENRLLANIGLEPKIGSTHELSLTEITAQLKQGRNPWTELISEQSKSTKDEKD